MTTSDQRITITKLFGPFAMGHRQALHQGHCKYVHGHDVKVKIRISALESQLTKEGFVYDFGKFKKFRTELNWLLDHKLLINEDDPEREYFEDMDRRNLADIRIVPNCGAEGMAKHVYQMLCEELKDVTSVVVESVEFFEDDHNTAIWQKP